MQYHCSLQVNIEKKTCLVADRGKWDEDEVERLNKAVQDYMKSNHVDKFEVMPWSEFAKAVKTRTWNQCMRQW